MKKMIYGIIALLFLPGCLDIRLEDQFSDPDAITTTATARELLASAYSSFPRYQIELSVISDDFVPTKLSSRATDLLNTYQWQEKALSDLSSFIWNDYYMTVAYLNALLPRLDNVVTEDDEDAAELEKIRSEAKALKAICYFDLLRIYAPLYTADNLEKPGIILKDRLELDFLPRSSLKASMDEIARLLSEAADVENNDASVFYLSTSAVKAVQTEVELYRGEYEAAVSVGLPLLADAETRWTSAEYDKLWTEDASGERLFAPYIFNSFYVELCDDRNTGDYFRLSDRVVFDADDYRAGWSVYQGPVAEDRSLGKYNRMYYENTEVRYINTLRYSGVCFAVAEAYARNDAPDEAIGLMNRYLGARGAALMDESLSGDELVEAILAEKQKEFVGEGVRWFDLKRLGQPLARYDKDGRQTATVKADDYRWLLPVPSSEYKYNDKITAADQNPGWPFEKTE